jgi:polyhydroxyalkanoate synthesis regulator phasin
LYVGGNTVVQTINSTTVNASVAAVVSSTTASTSTSTGALRVSGGAGIGGNLFVGGNSVVSGKAVFGTPPISTLYELDVSGQVRFFETTGSAAGTSTGSLVFEHGDASGVSSIVFRSKNASTNDYAYIQYQENVGGPLEKGVLTIGIENNAGTGENADYISLFAAGGRGHVGVNTKNPSVHLDVSGDVNATSYNATSDYRIKENVVPLDLTFNVDVLNPVSYNLKNGESRLHIGFIAHEVQEAYPFLVNGVKDGDTIQSINYNGFIGILTKEIQVLKRKDEENRDKIVAQESKIVAQESKIVAQESKIVAQEVRIQRLEEAVADLMKP